MPEPDRSNYIKKLSRQLRKAKGLKEDASFDTGPMLDFAGDKKDQTLDLFAAPKSGDWYFHSNSQKSKGYAEFKRKWGSRTNTDNWRRSSAATMPGAPPVADRSSTAPPSMNPDDIDVADPPKDQTDKKEITGKQPGNVTGNSKSQNAAASLSDGSGKEKSDQLEDLSYEGLMSGLPLSPEQVDESKSKVALALFELAKIYQEDLEDFEMAVGTYDSSLLRFPDSLYDGELYLGMYYCYTKMGDKSKANYYKNLLETRFPASKSTTALKNPDLLNPGGKTTEGTRMYENIYNQFIEGRFEEAIAGKRQADSLYGKNYWSPQLLYIEAVYYVKKKSDSMAIKSLNQIVTLFPDAPLRPRAERLIDVLGRRKEIEEYLTNLQVTRLKEDSLINVQPQRVRMIRNDSTILRPQKVADTTRSLPGAIAGKLPPVNDSLIQAPKTVSGPYVFNYTAAHQVIMLLEKVDGTYVNESKNAMSRYVSDYFAGQNITVGRDALDNNTSLIIFSAFTDAQEALNFMIKVRKAAPDELSWLPAGKYSFILIDNDNLTRMKNTKDIPGYKSLLKKQFPEHF
jgi:tetratricopeptide (TPR) repeat protein